MSQSSLTIRTPAASSGLQTRSDSAEITLGKQSTTVGSTQNAFGTPAQHQQITPKLRTPQQMLERPSSTPATPGKWAHPRMEEILRRRHRSTFDQTNATRIVFSMIALAALWAVPQILRQNLPTVLLSYTPTGTSVALVLAQILLLANVANACMPLVRGKDNMEDIPLTAQQRNLLDLPPMSRPATPQEQAEYVTPPRYSRNNTPTSHDSLAVNARGTPLSARGSPLDLMSSSSTPSSLYTAANTRVGKGSLYAGSPLSRTPEIGATAKRRDSLGSGRASPLSFAADKDMYGSPASKRASTGLNSKWLYDRSKPNAVTPSGLLGAGWGSGSVFN